MKKILFLLLLLTFQSGYATIWIINNSGANFVPAAITINLGDTVNFVITNAHDAAEVSQATWNANGNTLLPGGFKTPFGGGMVLPAQLGTGVHYYVCEPHAANGMKGTITVQNCTTPATPGTITGNATVCSGSSNTYSIAAVSGATSYTWTLPGGWTGTSTTTSINATAGITGGNITVSANNACGSSAPQTKNITVNTIPATPGSISGSNAVCAGSSNTYSITPVSGATSYTWTLPGGWSGSSTLTSINTTASTTSGNITVRANNSCGTSSAQTLNITVITAIPSTPGSISGNTNICAGSSNTYSVSAVSGATSYTWSLPGGWSGNSTTNSISTVAGISGGTIAVTANNSCGSSAAQILNVNVGGGSAPSQPGPISGNAIVCSGSSNTYSITAVAGATSYTWTLPGGWTGSSTTTSIITIAGTSGGNITVTANNACGSSAAQTKAITTSSVPSMPGTITGNAIVCNESSNTYSISAIPGATSYTWSLPNGWTGSSVTNSITVTAGSSGGNISVIANNNCGSSAAQTKNVNVTSVNVSVTQSGELLSASETGAVYQWMNCGSNLLIAGASSQTYSAFFNGSYAVIVTKNGCTDTSGCYTVTTAVPFTIIPMPDTLSGSDINLTIADSTNQFFSGFNTNTIGYNGRYLGPTIILNKGQTVNMHVTNMLMDSTSTHWHGLHVAPANDGGPHTLIAPGETWNPSFTVMDNASTYFYHPHMHGMTMEHVVKGAAGLIIVRDSVEASLNLPRTYGVDDIPLVCQYQHMDSTTKQIIVEDMLDNIFMVNGVLNPMVNVPAQVVRLRILNASSSKVLQFGFNDNRTFYQIGGDDGLLSTTVPLTRLRLGSGERAEILVDFSGQNGSTCFINQYADELPAGYPGGQSLMGDPIGPYDDITFSFLRINVVAPTAAPITTMPSTLVTNTPWDTTGAISMNFYLQGDPATSTTHFTINGQYWDMDVINFFLHQENVVIWNITNQSMMAHPFHIHGAHFFILSIDGNPPPPNLQGRKDNVLLAPIEGTATVIMKFEDFNDPEIPYMYHCHILSHEDDGMMGQFIVNPLPPSTPGTISGNTIVCPGSSETYTIAAVPGATSYTWTLPNGWTGTSITNSITAVVGTSDGNITVTADNEGGSSSAQSLAVSINPDPSQNCPVMLNIRVFLEGLYSGNGTMRPVLYTSGLTGDSLIADSIIIELRSAASPFNLLGSANVSIGINGHATASFPSTLNGQSAYIVVRHRNSLETWSKFPVILGPDVSFDFTSAQ